MNIEKVKEILATFGFYIEDKVARQICQLTVKLERTRAVRIIENYETTRMSPKDWLELKEEVMG